jgi:hypothetical protein
LYINNAVYNKNAQDDARNWFVSMNQCFELNEIFSLKNLAVYMFCCYLL